MRNLFLSAAFAACISIAGLEPAMAQIRTTDDSAPEAAEAGTDDAAEVSAEYGEELFVRESLPFLPSTNTIAAKLPLETGWTPANVGVVDLETLSEQETRVLGDALETSVASTSTPAMAFSTSSSSVDSIRSPVVWF